MSVGLFPDHIQEELPTVTVRPAIRRRFAGLALFLMLLGAALLVLLHITSKELNPLSQPISNYALTQDGWLFDIAIVVMALGLAALLCALVTARLVELGSGAFVVMVTCCVCLVMLDVFPDDASGRGVSATGWAHWASAMVAFGGLLVTPVVVGARHRSATGCSRLPGIARWLSYFAAAWFALLLGGSVMEQATRLGVWRVGGLVERMLSLSEVVVAMVLAAWARRGCPCISTVAGHGLDFAALGMKRSMATVSHVDRG